MPGPRTDVTIPGGAIPGDDELIERLWTREQGRRLVITPLLTPFIQGGTIDVRLGTKFIVGKRNSLPCLDPVEIRESDSRIIQQTLEIGISDSFYLHPAQLVLACTLEYVSLPDDLAAAVISRSTFGRAGLISATASHVHPGFKGCLTLELLNLGEVPIRLQPGLRIGQLVFYTHTPTPMSNVTGRYFLATCPKYPQLWLDDEVAILKRLRDRNATAPDPPA